MVTVGMLFSSFTIRSIPSPSPSTLSLICATIRGNKGERRGGGGGGGGGGIGGRGGGGGRRGGGRGGRGGGGGGEEEGEEEGEDDNQGVKKIGERREEGDTHIHVIIYVHTITFICYGLT